MVVVSRSLTLLLRKAEAQFPVARSNSRLATDGNNDDAFSCLSVRKINVKHVV
jgi:hypothetical protein